MAYTLESLGHVVHYRMVKDYGRFVMWENLKSGCRTCYWPEEKPEGMPLDEWKELRVKRDWYVDPSNPTTIKGESKGKIGALGKVNSYKRKRIDYKTVKIPMNEQNKPLIERTCLRILHGETDKETAARELKVRPDVVGKWLFAYKQKTSLFTPDFEFRPQDYMEKGKSKINGKVTYYTEENREIIGQLCQAALDYKISRHMIAKALSLDDYAVQNWVKNYRNKSGIFAR